MKSLTCKVLGAHVVSSRLVVGLVGLSASGDELVVGSAVVVVGIGERVEPWRGRGRGADGEGFVVRVSVWVNCVLDTDHVELAGVSTVAVVERVGFGVDDARGRVASVGGGLALSTDLSAVVVDGVVYADGRERDGSGVGLGAVLRVVCVDESGARVGVGAVEGLVLAHECDLVSWFDECAADEDVVAGVVGDLRFWEGCGLGELGELGEPEVDKLGNETYVDLVALSVVERDEDRGRWRRRWRRRRR